MINDFVYEYQYLGFHIPVQNGDFGHFIMRIEEFPFRSGKPVPLGTQRDEEKKIDISIPPTVILPPTNQVLPLMT